jgi:hypothetical protein
MSHTTKKAFPAALAAATLCAMVLAQVASATHPSPSGATPFRVPLVPAYKQCTTPNVQHGPPLAFPSCRPPVQSSGFLTVGTPDWNGGAPGAVGYLVLKVRQTSTDQVAILMEISDVRCKPATSASVCNLSNSADGPDYTGEIQGNALIRITDHNNGPSHDEAATVQDIPFPINSPCVSTADTSTGGFCSTTFSPGVGLGIPGTDYSGQRTVVQITQFEVYDGGQDGQASTSGDNTVFMRQGLFVP